MKNLLVLLLAFSCPAFAVENPVVPPAAKIVDRFGVNFQSGQLSRKLNTISIGGEYGLNHSVSLFTDFLSESNPDGRYGFIDGYAGSAKSVQITQNSYDLLGTPNGGITIRDTGSRQSNITTLRAIRVYGPAGNQDFLVFQSGKLDPETSAVGDYEYRPVGDGRHSLIESPDKRLLIWTTPEGIESIYERNGNSGAQSARAGARLKEITYPNGFKLRFTTSYINAEVTTNTGYMLKYQHRSKFETFDQMVAINLAHQYCAASATSCPSTGWPSVTFTWPFDTPEVFKQPSLPAARYLVKMTTDAGVTDIQYEPENVCIKNSGNEDDSCARSRGVEKWFPRLKSIRTPDSTVPNYQYKYVNKGAMFSTSIGFDASFGSSYVYWGLLATSGQITSATLNGTDTESYGDVPTVNTPNANVTWNNGEIWVTSAQYELNVIETVTDRKSGTYIYHRDSRHFVEKYFPIAGLGPAKHYIYDGPRGNLSLVKSIPPSEEQVIQKAEYVPGETLMGNYGRCKHPKTCNKPIWVEDARGNRTDYEYDPEGRFGNPIKITYPADKNGKRPATVYNYEPMYAYYKKDGESITQDPDPIWMLTSEHTCMTTEATSSGCSGGASDTVKTTYEYGPQNAGLPNNLLLLGKVVTAATSKGGDNMEITSRRTCFQYNKYGNKIGQTEPKAKLASCPQQ